MRIDSGCQGFGLIRNSSLETRNSSAANSETRDRRQETGQDSRQASHPQPMSWHLLCQRLNSNAAERGLRVGKRAGVVPLLGTLAFSEWTWDLCFRTLIKIQQNCCQINSNISEQ